LNDTAVAKIAPKQTYTKASRPQQTDPTHLQIFSTACSCVVSTGPLLEKSKRSLQTAQQTAQHKCQLLQPVTSDHETYDHKGGRHKEPQEATRVVDPTVADSSLIRQYKHGTMQPAYNAHQAVQSTQPPLTCQAVQWSPSGPHGPPAPHLPCSTMRPAFKNTTIIRSRMHPAHDPMPGSTMHPALTPNATTASTHLSGSTMEPFWST
jgi:hypothetical protein